MELFRANRKTNDEINNANEHNVDNNPKGQEADQLAIWKRDRRVELGSSGKKTPALC